MSEIRPRDIAAANTFRRTTISERAKLAGECDGHECPSYGEIAAFLRIFISLKDF